MDDRTSNRSESLTIAEARAMDRLCDVFEMARKSGEPKSIESILQDCPDSLQAPLFAELLAVDLQYRVMRGERPAERDYDTRWPQFQAEIRAGFHEATNSPPGHAKPSKSLGGAGSHVGVGKKLGRYEILDEIGRGAFGTVYRAYDPQLQRDVAVKIPRSERLADPEAVQRFLREARAAANLRHPHIVQVYDARSDEEACYIVSDLIEGEPLQDVLQQRRLGHRDSAKLVAQLATALHYAHTAKVVHRDIKPDNVLVDESGNPHIMDFGLARLEDDALRTSEGSVLGTPAYMSPEQAAGKSHLADARSDQWSLGVILYELLTGKRPFEGSERKVLRELAYADARSPRRIDPDIPKDLETICLKCLSREPGDRYPSCQGLASDLECWMRGEPIAARRPGLVERTVRWTRRNPAVAGLVATILLLVVVGGFAARLARENLGKSNQLEDLEKQKLRTEYIDAMHRVESDWQNRDIANVRRRLSLFQNPVGVSEDLRGWEWFYQSRLIHQNIRTFHGHKGAVYATAFHPDGTLIASAGQDGLVRIWDMPTGELQATIDSGQARVYALDFSPDGSWLAWAGAGSGVRLWDTKNGGEPKAFENNSDTVWDLSFRYDGQSLAVACDDGRVRFWNPESGRLTHECAAEFAGSYLPVRAVAFAPNGVLLASAGIDRRVRLWNLTRDESPRELEGHTATVNSLAFSHDGSHLASASDDNTVRIWDTVRGAELRVFRGNRGEVIHVAYSPEGKELASVGYDHCVKTWDVESGELRRTLCGHTETVFCATYSSNGCYLVSGSSDGTVRVWDTASGRDSETFRGHAGSVEGVAFDSSGRLLVSGSVGDHDASVKVWDVGTGRLLQSFDGQLPGIWRVDISSDGRTVASAGADNTVRLWDIGKGRLLRTLEGHSLGVSHVSFNPNGTQLVSASADGSVIVWDVAAGREVRRLLGHKGLVYTASYDPSGELVATCGRDAKVKIWDAHTGALQRTFTGHTAPVHSVTFSAGDRSLLASAGEDKTIIVWNRATGKAVVAMRGHIDRIGDVKFSHDGSRLASASDDNTIKIWDVATGRELRTLKGHSGEVRRLAFSSDGGLLASASSDQTIKVWDARPIDQLTADEREARALVEFMAGKPLMATDVVAEINVWTSIPDRVRQLAAEMAKKLPPSTQASPFENASWDAVVQPFLSPTHYRWAKLQAETAFELNGDGPQVSRTLGAAQYRCGMYEDATATLRRVIERAARPIDLAFLAMSYHHLANVDGAAESLTRLHEMVETGEWSERECNPRVLAEAQAVVEGKAIPIESTLLRKPTNLLERIHAADVLVLDEENSGLLSGKCHWKGQKQVIQFVAKKTGKMEARFRPSSTLQVYVWLYAKQDQNKDGLPDRVDGHQPSGKGQEGHVNYDVQAGETYYVEVVSMADPGWGTYELTVGQPPDD